MKIKKIDLIHLIIQFILLSSLLWFPKLPWDTQAGIGYFLGVLTIVITIPLAYLFEFIFKEPIAGGFIELLISSILHVFVIYLIIRNGFPNPYKFAVERKLIKLQKKIDLS